MVGLAVLLSGCTREALTVAPEPRPAQPQVPPSEPEEPEPQSKSEPEPAPLLPGSFASPPLDDWPCSATIELQDGGGIQDVQFAYDRRQTCAIPGELEPISQLLTPPCAALRPDLEVAEPCSSPTTAAFRRPRPRAAAPHLTTR